MGFINSAQLYLQNQNIANIHHENIRTLAEKKFLAQKSRDMPPPTTTQSFQNHGMHFETQIVMSSSVHLSFGEHTSQQDPRG
jgi:hypothetical protein